MNLMPFVLSDEEFNIKNKNIANKIEKVKKALKTSKIKIKKVNKKIVNIFYCDNYLPFIKPDRDVLKKSTDVCNIRVNWKGFVSSMKGMALDSLKRYDSKGVSRAFYLYFLLDRVYKNCGKMIEEDWRNPNLLYPCRDIRTNNDVFKQALSYTKNFDTLFDSFKELAVMPTDIKLTNRVQEECLIFFKDYLTSM